MLRYVVALLGLVLVSVDVSSCGGNAESGTGGQGQTIEEALAELDALHAPVGVDAVLFAELKAALASLLTAKAGADGRFVSAVPSGPAGEVTDLHFDAAGTLQWSYVNRGDYDQNSEVNAADIVPIAAHFRKNSASPDWAAAQVADGDGNGEINGADIVPIAGNFRGKVDGYAVQSSADSENGWVDVDEVTFAQGEAGDTGRSFQHAPAAPVHGHWYAVVPLGQGERGQRGNAVQYAAPIPQIVSVSPLSGREGADVQFAAVVSGPAPDTYSWDFGGGAVPNTSSEQSPSVTLGAPGSYDAGLMVSNAEGEDTFTFTLLVNPNQPPTASFTADPQSGSPGQVVQLDASASFDPDGSIVRYEWDIDDDGSFEIDTASPLAQINLPDPAGGMDLRLRVTDDSGATGEAAMTLSSANQPPVASFIATPQSGSPGDPVQLDASASSDPDGLIAQYEWDLDGDGSYETDGGAAPTRVTTLPDPAGTVSVGLRVTDNLGAQDTTSLDLTSSDPGGGTWVTVVVDSEGGFVGQYTSLALINGKPAISYLDYTNYDLKYAYSSMADGSSGWTAITVDTPGSVGDFTSLAEVNGKPAISYRNWSNQGLKYAYSTAADGSSGWTTLDVDASGGGMYTSLAVINDKPAISYSNLDLKYAYSSAADGSSGWTTLTVDSSIYAEFTSLALVNGKPAISYHDQGDLKYAYSSTADGSSGWTAIAVDTPGNVGSYSSVAVVNGKPAISYWDQENINLKYAYSSTADGSSGWTAITIETGGVGYYTSLAVVNGKPAISYWDGGNRDLKYAYCSTADGSSGWTTIPVDTSEEVGTFTSLAVLTNGRPAISYYDNTNGDLKYAVLMP